jgi:hypothetical protein
VSKLVRQVLALLLLLISPEVIIDRCMLHFFLFNRFEIKLIIHSVAALTHVSSWTDFASGSDGMASIPCEILERYAHNFFYVSKQHVLLKRLFEKLRACRSPRSSVQWPHLDIP